MSKSQKSKSDLFIIAIILVTFISGAIFYLIKKNKQQSTNPVSTMTEGSPESVSPKTVPPATRTQTPTPTSIPVETQKPTTPPVAQAPAEDYEPPQVTLKDAKQGIRHVVPRKKKSAQDLLAINAKIDPLTEFNKLMPIDFRNDESGMFSGIFIDKKANIRIAIYYDPDKNAVAEDSCIKTPSGDSIANVGGLLKMRDDQNGYAVLFASHNWYFKMAYIFAPNRTLIGKLYSFVDNTWKFVTDFSAVEAQYEKPLKKCEFPE